MTKPASDPTECEPGRDAAREPGEPGRIEPSPSLETTRANVDYRVSTLAPRCGVCSGELRKRGSWWTCAACYTREDRAVTESARIGDT